jgi:hypothetical protein
MRDLRIQTITRLEESLNTRAISYRELIRAVQAAVDQHIPSASTVLVLSKGDPALLSLGQRTAWHFPRADNGEYAGFHPGDSGDAIRRVEAQCRLGAQYLVIPATSAWWLDYYPDFNTHLRSTADVLFSDPAVGLIFRLGASPTQEAAKPATTEQAIRPSTQQLAALLEAVLPPAATVALIASKDDEIATHSGFRAVTFRYTDRGTDTNQAISDLRGFSQVADFLVIPASSREWLIGHPSLNRHIETSYRLVTDQRNVCRIYNLTHDEGGRIA